MWPEAGATSLPNADAIDWKTKVQCLYILQDGDLRRRGPLVRNRVEQQRKLIFRITDTAKPRRRTRPNIAQAEIQEEER